MFTQKNTFSQIALTMVATSLILVLAIGGGAVLAAEQPVKLVWLNHWSAPDVYGYWRKVADKYEQENPNVQIQILTAGWSDVMTKFMTMYAAGTSPDMLYTHSVMWLPKLVDKDALAVPPRDVMEEIAKKYVEVTVDLATYKGVIWGYPTENYTMNYIYNKRLLEEAGIALPPPAPGAYTIDEAFDATMKVSKGDVLGTAFYLKRRMVLILRFVNELLNAGGRFVSQEGKEIFPDTKDFKYAVEILQRWRQLMANNAAKLYETTQICSSFASGRIATLVSMPDIKFSLEPVMGAEKFEKEIGVANIPYDPKRVDMPRALALSFALTVSSQCKYPTEAWKFLRYIATAHDDKPSYMGRVLTETWGINPSSKRDIELCPEVKNSWSQAHLKLLSDGIAAPKLDWMAMYNILGAKLEMALLGQGEPEKLLAEAKIKIDSILSEGR